jgi:lipopolysaccharide biosynthesis glycosyltransferase
MSNNKASFDMNSLNQIVFAVNDKYAVFLAVALRSLLKASCDRLIVNILYSNLSKKNKYYFENLCKSKNFPIKFFHIDESNFKGLPQCGHLNIEAYYRMAIPNVLSANKVLYLDCDLLITSDLSPLFSINLKDFPLGAVVDPIFQPIDFLGMNMGAKYFNTGVMLLNLEYWRECNISGNALEYLRVNPHKITYADQCALNAIINGNFLQLDSKYNFQSGHIIDYEQSQILEVTLPEVIHFTGSLKPTHYLCESPYKNLFINELKKTHYRKKIILQNMIRQFLVFTNLYPLMNITRNFLKFFKM